jgi:hypothetical protein
MPELQKDQLMVSRLLKTVAALKTLNPSGAPYTRQLPHRVLSQL